MRLSLVIAVITALTFLSVTNGGDCKLSDKKLKKQIKTYENKCLSKGEYIALLNLK